MKSPPIFWTTSAGTGSATPPSTRTLSPILNGEKTIGTEALARKASLRLPEPISTLSPFSMSVATVLHGIARSSNLLLSRSRGEKISANLFPARIPGFEIVRSSGRRKFFFRPSCREMSIISSIPIPAAYPTPIIDPWLQPARRSIGISFSSSTFRTPRCEIPNAAPPPRATPTVDPKSFRASLRRGRAAAPRRLCLA